MSDASLAWTKQHRLQRRILTCCYIAIVCVPGALESSGWAQCTPVRRALIVGINTYERAGRKEAAPPVEPPWSNVCR